MIVIFIMIFGFSLFVFPYHAMRSKNTIKYFQQPEIFTVINGTYVGNITDTARIDGKGLTFYPSTDTEYVNVSRGEILVEITNSTPMSFISNQTVSLEITMYFFGKEIKITTTINANENYTVPGDNTLPFPFPKGTKLRFYADQVYFHVNISVVGNLTECIKVVRGSLTGNTLIPEYSYTQTPRTRYWISILWHNATDILLSVSTNVSYMLIRNGSIVLREYVYGTFNISVLANDTTTFMAYENFTIFIDYIAYSKWLYFPVVISVSVYPATRVYLNETLGVVINVSSIRPIKLVYVRWLNNTYILGYEAGLYNISLQCPISGDFILSVVVIDIYNLEFRKDIPITVLPTPVKVIQQPAITPIVIAIIIASVLVVVGVYSYIGYKTGRKEAIMYMIFSYDAVFLRELLLISIFAIILALLYITNPIILGLIIGIFSGVGGACGYFMLQAPEVVWCDVDGSLPDPITSRSFGILPPTRKPFKFEYEGRPRTAIKVGVLPPKVLVFEWGDWESPLIFKVGRFLVIRGKPVKIISTGKFGSQVILIRPYTKDKETKVVLAEGLFEKTQRHSGGVKREYVSFGKIITQNQENPPPISTIAPVTIEGIYNDLSRKGYNGFIMTPVRVKEDLSIEMGDVEDQKLLLMDTETVKFDPNQVYLGLAILPDMLSSFELEKNRIMRYVRSLVKRIIVHGKNALIYVDSILTDVENTLNELLMNFKYRSSAIEIATKFLGAEKFGATLRQIGRDIFTNTLRRIEELAAKVSTSQSLIRKEIEKILASEEIEELQKMVEEISKEREKK